MNQIEASVEKIESSGIVHIVTLGTDAEEITMMALELPGGVKEGTKVTLGIKPSFVLIAKSKSEDISLTNQIYATIVEIIKGELLVTIKLKSSVGLFESLITKKSFDMVGLKEEQKVVVMMKASEVSIAKVHSEV